MDAGKKSQPGWGACKLAMKHWPRPGVIALVQELYQLSDENRRFLHARLLPQSRDKVQEATKRKLKQMLSAKSIYHDRFRHADLKRVIDQFAKATNDAAATADILIADLEFGFTTLNEVGDFEPMVDHLYATLARLEKILENVPPESLAGLTLRLNELAKKWGTTFGYGISDELTGFAEKWNEFASNDATE